MAAVSDIAESLRAFAVPSAATASLSGGFAGLAVFFAAFAEFSEQERDSDAALTCLDLAADAVASQTFHDFGLYTGPVGVGWAYSVLEDRLLAPDADDSDVDTLVQSALAVSPWPGIYDLVGGLVGLGTYCLERLPRASALRSCELVVNRLAQSATTTPLGVTWLSQGSLGTPALLEAHPDGYVDLGLAHGVAGIVAFLAHAASFDVPGAEELLKVAVGWLRGQRLPEASSSCYPGVVPITGERLPTRVAWCYGDLGIASALLAAGVAAADEELQSEALALMRQAGGRVEHRGILDAGICHGAAGIGHILNRAGQSSGDGELLTLARRSMLEVLDLRSQEHGLAGFPAYRPAVGGVEASLEALPGLLEGASGVGLALLSAAGPFEPWWDACLLVHPARGRV